ncbi:DNA topoisomerase III [Moraxellaceae bacterium AER2_44_116]|nr:DNA topoisomerase 3 [Moraxellaceae bacterium]TQC96608.1 DNA topoisomerase III [Moraxellaceae bacterium AER2_44_116]
MTTVIIAEKPSVANELAKYLGHAQRADGYISVGNYRVTWCFGHLLTLAEPHVYDEKYKKWRADDLPILPQDIKIIAKDDAGIRKQLKIIGGLLKEADDVIHAGDPDREGQLLVDWVLQHHKNRKPVKRLWLAAQDSVSIQKALRNLQSNLQYAPLFQAAQTRSIADWLVGINLSRAFTLAAQKHGYRGVVSIGRVQTPTLALIAMRDHDIETFISKTYYVPMVLVGVEKGSFWATWIVPESLKDRYADGKITDLDFANAILQIPETGVISLLEKKKLQTAPPLPYRLSRLQKDASARFGLTADEVLTICQSLYEDYKLTSYPRTDCDYLPESQHSEARDIFAALTQIYPTLAPFVQQANTSLKSSAWNDKNVTAHHAIIPVRGNGATYAQLKDKEQKVYDLIARAYLAQFFPAYEFEKTDVETTFDQKRFKATGNIPLKEGWKVLYPPHKAKTKTDDSNNADTDDKEPEQALPPIILGETARKLATEARQKQTHPPKAYTDGTLISDMESVHRVVASKTKDIDNKWLKLLKENAGLGTEATRAGILKTLLDRGFIQRSGKNITATTTGRELIKALPKEVKSPIATAMMEQELAAIEKEGLDPDVFLAKQRASIEKLIGIAAAATILLSSPEVKSDIPIKAKRTSKAKLTSTKATSATAKKPRAKAKSTVKTSTEKTCPECQKPMILRARKSDGQKFWGCSGFPNCRCVAQVNA